MTEIGACTLAIILSIAGGTCTNIFGMYRISERIAALEKRLGFGPASPPDPSSASRPSDTHGGP